MGVTSVISLESPFDQIVRRLVAERPEPLGMDSTCDIEVEPMVMLRRAYSRLLRLELRGGGVQWRGYVKLAMDPPTLEPAAMTAVARARREFDTLVELQSRLSGHAQLGVVRPVAFFPEYPAIVTEETPGRDLLAEFKVLLGFRASERALVEAERLCRGCGQWLAAFQATAAPCQEMLSLDAVREYNQRRIDRLVQQRFLGCDRAWGQAARRLIDALALRATRDVLRTTRVHGDFALGNVLVSGHRIVVLDFPMTDYGSPLLDVTHFHHQLRLMGMNPRFRRRTTERLTRAFLAGYDAQLDDTAALFRLLQVQHVLCQLSRLTRRTTQRLGDRMFDRYVAGQQRRWLDKACASWGNNGRR